MTLAEAGYSADKITLLAEEQSAATQDVFTNTEEIVDSVIILTKNMEAQTQNISKIMEILEGMPPELANSREFQQIKELLQEGEILTDVGANKAVEIASATQEQRAAARDLAAAARRLSEMATELKDMVNRFKTES